MNQDDTTKHDPAELQLAARIRARAAVIGALPGQNPLFKKKGGCQTNCLGCVGAN